MEFSENVSGIVDELELEKGYDKAIIKYRFLDEISFYEKKRDHTRKYYNSFSRLVLEVGSHTRHHLFFLDICVDKALFGLFLGNLNPS